MPEAQVATSARNAMRYIGRSRACPSPVQRNAFWPKNWTSCTPPQERACLDASSVAPFHMLRSWFPLMQPLMLKRLRISGRGLGCKNGASPCRVLYALCSPPSALELSVIARARWVFFLPLWTTAEDWATALSLPKLERLRLYSARFSC